MRLIVLIFLMFSFGVKAQERSEVDSLSYAQFITDDYTALLETGEKALANNIDFYYLRMRLGIASYNHQRFTRCIPHFEKALEMYSGDTLAQEYLYFALLETNQSERAREFARDFSPSMLERLSIKFSSLESIALSGGFLYNTLIEDNKNKSFLTMVGTASETKLFGNLNFGDLTAKFYLKNRLKLTANFSFFDSKSLLVAQVDKVFHYFTSKNSNYQFNLITSYALKKKWNIHLGSAYYLNESPNFLDVPGDSMKKIPPSYKLGIRSTNSFMATFRMERNEQRIQPYFGFTFSNIYAVNQLQLDLGTSYYPFGNMNVYGKSNFSIVINDSIKPVFAQTIGFKLFKNTWLEASFMHGKLQNFILDNGLLTFNTPDPIMINVGVDLIVRFKKISIVPSYRFQERQLTTTIRRHPPLGNVFVTDPYKNHVFNLSLKWNF